MVKSAVVFQCLTSASFTVVWANAGRASAASVNSRFIVILPRDIIDTAPIARRATPGEFVGSNNRLPLRGSAAPMATRSADRYFELKSEIHRKLIGVLNL